MEKQLVMPWPEVAKAIGWWIRCHYDQTFTLRDGDFISVEPTPNGLVIERVKKDE